MEKAKTIVTLVSLILFLLCQGFLIADTKNIMLSKPGFQIDNYNLGLTNYYQFGSTRRVNLENYDLAWHIATTGTISTRSGDITGDGKLELIYTDGTNLVVLKGNGEEIFRRPTSTQLSILADLNNDGKLEAILIQNNRPYAQIHFFDWNDRNKEQMFFKTITTYIGTGDTSILAHMVADMDGTGNLKLIARKVAGYSMQPRGIVVFDVETGNELGYYAVGPFPQYITVADVTGGSAREIIFGTGGPANGSSANGTNDSSCYTFCLNHNATTRVWLRQYEGSGFVDASVNVADVNGNGFNDIVTTSYSHGWDAWGGNLGRVYILNQNGTINKQRQFSPRPVWMAGLADLNKNGLKEIIIHEKDANGRKGRILALNHDLQTLHTFTPSQNAIAYLQTITDLTGDGNLELIAIADDTLYVLDNKLNEIWKTTLPPNARSCFVSDLDNDGTLDIVVLAANELYVYSAGSLPELDLNLRVTTGKTKAFLEWNPYVGEGNYRYEIDVKERFRDGGTYGLPGQNSGWQEWKNLKRIDKIEDEYILSPRFIVAELKTSMDFSRQYQYAFRVIVVNQHNAEVAYSREVYGQTLEGPEVAVPTYPIVLVPGVGSTLDQKKKKTFFKEIRDAFEEIGWKDARPATVSYTGGNYFSQNPYPSGIEWKRNEVPEDFESVSVFTFVPYRPSTGNEIGIAQKGIELGYFLQHLGFKGKGNFQLAGHSLGGLTCRAYIQRDIEPMSYRNNVVRFISTGSPLNGVAEYSKNLGLKDILSSQYMNDEWRKEAFKKDSTLRSIAGDLKVIGIAYKDPYYLTASLDDIISKIIVPWIVDETISRLESKDWDFSGRTLEKDVLKGSPFLQDLNNETYEQFKTLPNIHYVSLVNEIRAFWSWSSIDISLLSIKLPIPFGGFNSYLDYGSYVGDVSGGDGIVSTQSQNLSNLTDRDVQVIKREMNHINEASDHIGILMGLGYPTLSIKAKCPVDLEVFAPSGNYIAKGDTAMFLATYREVWVDGQDTPHDIVEIPFPEDGEYIIRVIPTPEAMPDDIFTLLISRNGEEFEVVYEGRIYEIDEDGYTATVDNTPPIVEVVFPTEDLPVQGMITLQASVEDMSAVETLKFTIRGQDGADGIPVGFDDLSAEYNDVTGQWDYYFDSTQLPDGYYIIFASAVDEYGNEGVSEVVPFSIRNWEVIELLPPSKHNPGRTVPVKFSLRYASAVDPMKSFVYKEDLEVRIFRTENPDMILQSSFYGNHSTDYRIDVNEEHYITNFRTTNSPAEYTVEVWATDFLLGSFSFETAMPGRRR